MAVGAVSQSAGNPLKSRAEKYVESVSGEFELDAGIDGIQVEYLGPGVAAQTRFERGRVEVVFDQQQFFRLPEFQKRKVALHELLHVKQFRNTLGDWLRQNFGVSRKFAREFSSRKNVPDMEGEVELLVDQLLPRRFPSSYPYQKERREREIKRKGIDIEAELLDEVEELGEELVENYVRDVEYGVQHRNTTGYAAESRGSYPGVEQEYLDSFDQDWGAVEDYLVEDLPDYAS